MSLIRDGGYGCDMIVDVAMSIEGKGVEWADGCSSSVEVYMYVDTTNGQSREKTDWKVGGRGMRVCACQWPYVHVLWFPRWLLPPFAALLYKYSLPRLGAFRNLI